MVKRLGDNPLGHARAETPSGTHARNLIRDKLIHFRYKRETEKAYEYLKSHLHRRLSEGNQSKISLNLVNKLSEEVYDYLKSHEAAMTPQIARYLNMDVYTVMKILKDLKEAGKVMLITVPARAWKAPLGCSRAIIAASALPL